MSRAAFSGIGAGAIYATCIGQAVKWFPDRRGLAVGLTAAGFGAGAALTVIPIREVIASAGYQTAFFWFGLVQGTVVFLVAWLLRAPEMDELKAIAPPKVVAVGAQLQPGPGSGVAGFLGALRDVHHGVGQRLDGNGADCA